jgi:hypothetical protein
VIHDYKNASGKRWSIIKPIFDKFTGLSSGFHDYSGGSRDEMADIAVDESVDLYNNHNSAFNELQEYNEEQHINQVQEDDENQSTILYWSYLEDTQYNVELSLQKFIDDIKCEIIMNVFLIFSQLQRRENMAKYHNISMQEYISMLDLINYIKIIPLTYRADISENDISVLFYIYSDISDLFHEWLKHDDITGSFSITSDTGLKSTSFKYFKSKFENFTIKNREQIEIIIWSYHKFDISSRDRFDTVKDEFIAEFNSNRRKRDIENIDENSPKSQRQNGGGRDKLDDVNATRLVEVIKKITGPPLPADYTMLYGLSSSLFTYQQTYYAKKNILQTQSNPLEFNRARNELIQLLGDIYIHFQAGKYKNALEKIPLLTPRGFRNLDIDSKIKAVIDLSIEVPSNIAKTAEESNVKKLIRIARELKKEQSGDLNKEDRDQVSIFMKLIARMGLIITGLVIPEGLKLPNGTITTEYIKEITEPTLQQQINILAYIASDGVKSSFWEKANKTKSFGNIDIFAVTNSDIDKNLESYYDLLLKNQGLLTQSTEITEQKIICKNKKYIIDNATIKGGLNRWSFCPYSSIIDGMKKCTWKIANEENNIERGDMNFKIRSVTGDFFYEGKMILDSPASPIVSLEFNIQLPTGKIIEGKKPYINVSNDLSLEAPVVLGDTLKSIIDLNIQDDVDTNIGIIQTIETNLFKEFPDPQLLTGSETIPLYAHILRKILFKAVGDLFQEINAVAKFGGYTGINYNCDTDDPKIDFNGSGNTVRFFASNDRPSGTRFMFMLENGRPHEINMKAYGGYYPKDDDKDLLTHRIENTSLCDPNELYIAVPPLPRGGDKNHTRKMKSKTHKKRAHKKAPKRQTKRPVKRLPNRSRKARKPLKTK